MQVFTRHDALTAGWSPAQVQTRLRSGAWVALSRGAYVDAARLAEADPRGRHLLHAQALLRTHGSPHVLSHRTAAVAHGWPLLGRLPPRPLLTRAPRGSTDASPHRFVRVAGLAGHDVVVVGGLRATSAARTVVDVARHESRRSALVVADAALRAGLTREELLEVAERCSTWPGGRRALQVVRFADPLAESPLESIARLAFAVHGLPRPELQVQVRDERGRVLGVVDFLWRAQRTAGELDGLLKYSRLLDLRREKEREDDLRRTGLEVVRGGWREAWSSPALLCRRVEDAFDLAASRLGVPARFVLPPAAA